MAVVAKLTRKIKEDLAETENYHYLKVKEAVDLHGAYAKTDTQDADCGLHIICLSPGATASEDFTLIYRSHDEQLQWLNDFQSLVKKLTDL